MPSSHVGGLAGPGPGPLLAEDGCIQAAIVEAFPETLPAGSRYERVEGVGHFMQLEDPPRVNALITEWVGAPR